MTDKQEIVNTLLAASGEIKSLRRQVIEIKAEAWDVHSEVIKRLFSGPQVFGLCSANQAETLANKLLQSEVVDEQPAPDAPAAA